MPNVPSLADRLDVIESAVGSALGIDLSKFDSTAAVSGRIEAIRAAAEEIIALADGAKAAAAKKAAEQIVPLSELERIERLEAAFRSRGSL